MDDYLSTTTWMTLSGRPPTTTLRPLYDHATTTLRPRYDHATTTLRLRYDQSADTAEEEEEEEEEEAHLPTTPPLTTTTTTTPRQPLPVPHRNQTSRFFSFNSGSQTLDLGLSFTVPFLSIPVGSLLSLGNTLSTTTSTAVTSLMDINWPAVLFIGVAVLAASFLLPKITSLLSALVTGGLVTGYSGASSFPGGSYGRGIDVDPVTSIVTQIEEALAQYDLDASSCIQRSVCSFVHSSGEKLRSGEPDSAALLAVGLAKNKWLTNIIGDNTLTKAATFGQEQNQDCSLQYPECPVSLPDVVRGLMSVVT
ncbi:uncharacterized protein LOC123506684 [Portunus trituberculatus]|uniref:uncharacterized protein LOC123506684 n=1 Tax=Portunus trituberculatus TaxID=210409 RepID=UPI001E1CF187|nr:uncharacterized protein LOC123506684 [Portunus trituberculatus]